MLERNLTTERPMSIVTTIIELLMSLLNGLFGAKPKVVPAPAGPRIQARTAAPSAPPRAPAAVEDEDDEEDETARVQAALEAQQREMQGWMDDAVGGDDSPLLEPIDGVSVEMWASIAAALTTLGDDPDGYHRLLAEHDLDAERYEAAQAGWIQRMQSVDDPMAAGAIAQIYGKAFTTTRTGSATATSGGDAPCTFERYCEIMGAQSAWAGDGRDVNALLGEVFGITASDWSDYGAYWNAQIMADYTLAGKMGELTDRYTEQHRSTDDPDADLVL